MAQDNSDSFRVIQLVNYRAGSRSQIFNTEIILYVKEKIFSFSMQIDLNALLSQPSNSAARISLVAGYKHRLNCEILFQKET